MLCAIRNRQRQKTDVFGFGFGLDGLEVFATLFVDRVEHSCNLIRRSRDDPIRESLMKIQTLPLVDCRTVSLNQNLSWVKKIFVFDEIVEEETFPS